jgi:HD-GYP domain-containing protein (c-di-GMP phosphodiesterase class II)
MSPEVAIEELERCSGTQFDPSVVAAFRDVFNSEESALELHA